MEVTLQISDATEIRKKFFALKSRLDIAQMLEIPYKVVNYYLYMRHPSTWYVAFSIPKKSGGLRQIYAPTRGLKIIQQKLNYILQRVYCPKPSVHGFTLERSILSNAFLHCNKAYVLNIDLLDFFPSINFGRVRGLFMGIPYNLDPKVATTLAQICCFANQLPQGAPTSPVVSNMICAKMDSQLQQLAKKHRCTYTRYADDITFSTSRRKFPQGLAAASFVDGSPDIQLGHELQKIIKHNGFLVNNAKVRLQKYDSRQEVTGVTVNKFPNVTRKYQNQIRAMLHAWDKYGAKAAGREFLLEYNHKHRGPSTSFVGCNANQAGQIFKQVVRGKINYLRMIRGDASPVCQRLCAKLAELDVSFAHVFHQNIRIPEFSELLWVVEYTTDINGKKDVWQGTAFVLEGIGLVTCAHAVGKDTYVYNPKTHPNHCEILSTVKDSNLDIAILKTAKTFPKGFKKGDSNGYKRGNSITLLGYPNHAPGQSFASNGGHIVNAKILHGVHTIQISPPIYHGNSGGPVLNHRNEVIGIATRGPDTVDTSRTVENTAVKIHQIDTLA